MEKKDLPYQKIIRFLEGKLNTEEVASLNQWRAALPENEKYFQETQFIWEKSSLSQADDDISIDVNAALQKVQEQILPNPKPIHQARRRFLRIASAAAIALLLIDFWGISNNSVDQISISTLANEQRQVSLPDQSIVWLNENSTLTYPQSFEDLSRAVKLSGDAVFEVTHDKKHPFIVHSENLAVKVLGTKFNVITHREAASFVHVINGKVQVTNVANPDNQIIITKDQSVAFDAQTDQLALTEAYDSNQLFWMNKTLTFSNSTLKALFEALQKYYAIDLQIQNSDLLNCAINGQFKDQTVDEILATIQPIYNFEIQKTNPTIYKITKGTCH